MGKRRILSTGAVVLALTAVGPAWAAETVVVSTSVMPAGIAAESRTCQGPYDPTAYVPEPATVSRVAGPGVAPRGGGSLAVVPPAGKDAGLRLTSLPMPLTSLTALSVAVRKPMAAQGMEIEVAVTTKTGEEWFGGNGLQVPADTWQSIDFASLKLNWFRVTPFASITETTIAELATYLHNDAPMLQWLMVHAGNCASVPAGSTFNFDNLRVGIDGNDTVYDFELPAPSTPQEPGKVASKVTLKLADRTLKVGSKLVAKGKVSPPAPGARVTLWRSTSKGKVRLGKGKVAANGSYKVAVVVRRAGRWKVFVTVPATASNLSGTLSKVTAKVV